MFIENLKRCTKESRARRALKRQEEDLNAGTNFEQELKME